MFRFRNEQVNELLRETSPYIFESATATVSSKMFDDGSEAINEHRFIEFLDDQNRRANEDYFRSLKDPARFQVDDVLVYMSSVDDGNDGDDGAIDMMNDPGVDPSLGAASSEELRLRIEADDQAGQDGADDSSGVNQLTSGMEAMASPSARNVAESELPDRVLTRSSFFSPGGIDDSAESPPNAPEKEDDDFPEDCERDDYFVVSH